MAASEILIGLWLRGLKPKKCLKIVSEWDAWLSAPKCSANDNCGDGEDAQAKALALLRQVCAHCPKICPRAGGFAVVERERRII